MIEGRIHGSRVVMPETSPVADLAPDAPQELTWSECAALGMTSVQAARAKGTSVATARNKARLYGLVWAQYQRGSIAPGPDGMTVEQAQAAGMTARQAAVALGVSDNLLRGWARKRGLSWAPPERPAGRVLDHVRLWDLQRDGATLAEAGRATGLDHEVLSTWAIERKVAWSRGEAQAADLSAAFAEGLTARQAAQRMGVTIASVMDWALRTGVAWPACQTVPDAPRDAYDDSDLDPVSCRNLWRHVLSDQVRYLTEARVVNHTGALSPIDQLRALRWFWTPDAEVVAQCAGVDADVPRDTVRVWAVKQGLMRPGQDRP